MKVSFEEVNQVVNTLPIGLYAKRRIPLSLNDKSMTSCYNTKEDRIEISFKQVAKALEMVDEKYRENSIRANVYHELSHAILTPSVLVNYPAMNIFEDERIETILKDYYLDVNFKENVFHTNGLALEDTLPPADTNLQGFYYLVRFRHCANKDFLDRVDTIIERFKGLDRSNDACCCREYRRAVDTLFEDFCDWFKKKDPKSEGSSSGEEEKDGEKGKEEETVGEMLAKFASEASKGDENEKAQIKEIFDKVTKGYFNQTIFDKLQAIITQFNKKNRKGSAFNTYSGVFNPRATARDDYRYFERNAGINGNNSYGTLHLNLFLDDSGSFWHSAKPTNEIIRALIEIERKNPIFSFDVYFIAKKIRKAKTDTEKYINPDGGNWLHKEIFDVYRKAQNPGTFNYNIILFDGDAFSDYWDGFPDSDKKNFKAFDYNNALIITDNDNLRYLEKSDMRNAKIIYTSNYVGELAAHVTQALSIAFR